jgi:chemotaxis protein CheX
MDLQGQAYEGQIREIVSDLFRAMLQMEVDLALHSESNHASVVTATIDFVGPWKGILELRCSREQAHCFAERFLQMSLTAYDAEVHDTVGELANIIAGNLKQVLPERVSLGTPKVIFGPAVEVQMPKGKLMGSHCFASDAGLFTVTLLKA